MYSLSKARHKVFIGQATPTLLFLFVKIRRNKELHLLELPEEATCSGIHKNLFLH